MSRTDIRRERPHAPIDDLRSHVELPFRRLRLALPQSRHPLYTVRDNRQHGLINRRGIAFSDGIPHSSVALMTNGVELTCRLDHLISYLTGYLEDQVEEEERDVSIEGRL